MLLMSKVSTVFKLIPSRVFKKVLVMVTLLAVLTDWVKVRLERAGRAAQLMIPTVSRALNWRVDKRVKLLNSKVPAIVAIEVLVRDVIAPLFSTIKSPLICSGPSIAMVPGAVVLIKMSPLMVVQSAKAVASAAELMVAVG